MNDLATFIITILNALVAAYVLLYKGRREGKKLEVESESVAAEVAERNLKSAEISNQMLVDSVNRLKQELEEERQARKADLEQERQARKAEVEAERETRKKEVEYLRRRLRDAERETRDLRQWAAQLVKQVVEAGKIPATYIPSVEDSQPSITAIKKEEE